MSLGVIVVQYLVPCIIVTVCYCSVCKYLANRPILASSHRQAQILAKRKKNNNMLIVASAAHFLSWLPLNVVNMVITTFDTADEPLFEDIEKLFITYAICHIASMTSAISNPILYGFMNENFREEFTKIWANLKIYTGCLRMNSTVQNNNEEPNAPTEDRVPLQVDKGVQKNNDHKKASEGLEMRPIQNTHAVNV